jgi:hypothetical protein
MSDEQIVRIMNLWMDSYIADPKQFAADFQQVMNHLHEKEYGETPSYGASCLAYMQHLYKKIEQEDAVLNG